VLLFCLVLVILFYGTSEVGFVRLSCFPIGVCIMLSDVRSGEGMHFRLR